METVTHKSAVDGSRLLANTFQAHLTACGVGSYHRDERNGLVHGDAVMAHLFGIDVDEMAAGVTLTRIARCIHPDDVRVFRRKQADLDRFGGIAMTEYRTVPRPGEIRWVLVRGRYGPAEEGQIAPGYGIVIDVTSLAAEEPMQAAYAIRDRTDTLHPIEQMADHAMAVWRLTEGSPGELRDAAETMLVAAGRALARLPLARRH